MWLTRISVKYPVFTIMMMFCLMVLGLASWQRMGVEEFPDVDFPFVWFIPLIQGHRLKQLSLKSPRKWKIKSILFQV